MINSSVITQNQADSDDSILGKTLLSLLDEACDSNPNYKALNQWHNHQWQSVSNVDFRQRIEEIALGLKELKLAQSENETLQKGDSIALVMHNDINFCMLDMASLLIGIVNVPIDLTQTIENIFFILQQTQAKVLVISNLDLFYQLYPYLGEAPTIEKVIIVEVGDNWQKLRRDIILQSEEECLLNINKTCLPIPEDCLHIPQFLCESGNNCLYPVQPFPQCLQLLSLDEVREEGKKLWSKERVQFLRDKINPSDLATIIYIASESKRPKGVMLTHENISANVLASFGSYSNLKKGKEEVALLFLPLTHIFARVFFYGHLTYGHTLYFSTPNQLIKHLKTVQPTIMITVPRLLEKIYERIVIKGHKLKKFDKAIFNWAFKVAKKFDFNKPVKSLYSLQLQLADRLVFHHWRKVFGNQLKALICGGAGLSKDLTNFFLAAKIPVLQGYGLTEASGVLSYNREFTNISGTVGTPIGHVKFKIADDGEILVKSPFTMQGYYQDVCLTQKAIDDEGWLHTGDLGKINDNGVLTITGVKKSLFKLSTGKYVSALPLEEELMRAAKQFSTDLPLVDYAMVIGANRKFCGMLIFPNFVALQNLVAKWNLDLTEINWLEYPRILAIYQKLIHIANCHLPYWSNVRKFLLIDSQRLHSTKSDEKESLISNGKLNRLRILEVFAKEIDSLYMQNSSKAKFEHSLDTNKTDSTPEIDSHFNSSCPIYAQSLTHS